MGPTYAPAATTFKCTGNMPAFINGINLVVVVDLHYLQTNDCVHFYLLSPAEHAALAWFNTTRLGGMYFVGPYCFYRLESAFLANGV